VKHDEEGSALVEMAMSSALVLTVLIGVFQASLMLYTYHFMSYAARQGARYAIVRGSDSCYTPGVSTSNISDCNDSTGSGIVSYVQGLSFPGVNWSQCTKTSPCVTVSWPNGTNAPGNPVQVQINYPYSLYVPWVKPITLTLTSTSTMYISN
jgi:Flp pilus assembly protein TadG